MGYKTNMPFSDDPVLSGRSTKTPGDIPSVNFSKNQDSSMINTGLSPHHDEEMRVENDKLIIPTLTIIDSMPVDCLQQNWHSQLDSTAPSIEFDKSDVLNVLQQGAFRVTVGPLACMLPNTIITEIGFHSQQVTELPIDEVLENIPTHWFLNPNQDTTYDQIIAEMDNPFDVQDTVSSAEEPKLKETTEDNESKTSGSQS